MVSRYTRGPCGSSKRPAPKGYAARSSRRARTVARYSRLPASRPCSRCASTESSPSRSACAGSPRPTCSSPPPRSSGSSRARAVFEDADRRCRGRSRRRVRLGRGRRPRRASEAALRDHGADIVVADLAELLESGMIEPGIFSVEPWAVTELRAGPRSARSDRVDLRPVERPHRAARQPRRRRAARRSRVRTSTASSRALPLAPTPRRGYGYPEEGPIADRRDQRQARSGCSSTTSRSTSATARCSNVTSGCSTCAMAYCAATSDWTSPAGQAVRVRSTRLVSFVQRSVAAICYEVEALDRPARIVVQSTLVANEPVPPEQADDPRAAAALRAPLVGRVPRAPRPRGGARASDARQRAADGGRARPRRRRARRDGRPWSESERRPGAGHGQHGARARARPCGS